MCGRVEYVITDRRQLEDHYGAKLVEGYTDQGIIHPRYNVPPSSNNPIVTSEDNEEIIMGHWGYLPNWAKERKGVREVINARAETVFDKPYFKSSIEVRRCLIPVTGFFEWKREDKKKTPFRFHMNGEIFSLGGVYTSLPDKGGIERPHYAIITTEANELMAPVHDRMPVIIDKPTEAKWVSDEITDKEIRSLFVPFREGVLFRDEISSLVNSPRHDGPDILKPVAPTVH